MPTTLDVFISSKMVELKAEREAIYELLPTLNYGDIKLRAWVFENDAPASNQSIREVYLKALKDSALYIGLFWNQYGEWTIDEFDRAVEWGIERHIYVKDVEAERRDEKLDSFLKTHGSVTEGITAKWFKTTDDLYAAVKQSLDTWAKAYLSGPRGETSARLYGSAGEILERAKKLIGRDDLLQQVNSLFDNGEQVLLQGFSGSGKTALAAEIAAGHCPALWLRAGRNDADELFEGLAREFNAQEAIAKASGDQKIHVMRSLLAQSGVRLLVLDDVWNGQALQTLVKAMPPDIRLLVTSRRRYGIDSIVEVGDLTPESATELLGFHANQDYSSHAQARELCQILGHLAFAIRIAGLNLKINRWNPAELAKKIQAVPHELATPLDFLEKGRENIAKLIQVSMNALNEEARAVFVAMGAFFAPHMTAEMVVRFFEDTPEVSDDDLKEVRKQNPHVPSDMPDGELRKQYIRLLVSQPIDATTIEKHLTTLVQHGLITTVAATENVIAAYRLHDLAYSYARAQNGDEQRGRALDACLAYVARYKESSLPNFAALRPELDNLLNAASWAFGAGHYAAVERFAGDLWPGADLTGGFLAKQGFSSQAILLLEQAADAAERAGNKRDQGAHLGNLGSAYFSLGQVERAIGYYEQALSLSREIGDRRMEGAWLGNLGLAYSVLGQVERAIGYYEQTLAISRDIGDRRAVGSILGNLGTAYYSVLGQVEHAIGHYEQALSLSREIGDRRMEGNNLGNLGLAYSDLGQVERAIGYYEQALSISREIGDRRGEGNDLGNLGNAYNALGQVEKAIEYHEQALSISREIGDKHGEGNQLGSLGNAYNALGQVVKAIGYFEQGLSISREIGDRMREAHHVHNLGTIYEDQNKPSQALKAYELTEVIVSEIKAAHLVEKIKGDIARVRGKLGGG